MQLDKILIATDAWSPQVNGVVTTLKKIEQYAGDKVCFITPSDFKTYGNFVYPEIRLAFPSQRQIDDLIRKNNPKYIHISTEGPIGWAVRKWCIKNNFKFTTSYHTKFPEFIESIMKVPTWVTYWFFRKFHNAGSGMFVATPSLEKYLSKKGFNNLISWSRGVDLEFFSYKKAVKKKYLLYVGRVSKEKNIEAFLDIDLPGFTNVVVGDGPELVNLKNKYPKAHFTGKLVGPELAKWYQQASVFVFPSKKDTFGLVMLEALACGTPVVAYPVTGPIDVITQDVGVLTQDLSLGCIKALQKDNNVCRAYAEKYDWKEVVNSFILNVKKVNS